MDKQHCNGFLGEWVFVLDVTRGVPLKRGREGGWVFVLDVTRAVCNDWDPVFEKAVIL